MDCVILQHTNKNYYITLEIITRWEQQLYYIQCCPIISKDLCGYPEREMTYNINDKKKAYNTFKRYVKKYI